MNTSKKTIIYGLTDPTSGQLVYIGATRMSLARILYMHAIDAHKQSCTFEKWFYSLILSDRCPEVIRFDVCDESTWKDSLDFWIAYYHSIGSNFFYVPKEERKLVGYRLTTSPNNTSYLIEKRYSALDILTYRDIALKVLSDKMSEGFFSLPNIETSALAGFQVKEELVLTHKKTA